MIRKSRYTLLFFLLGLVYLAGLFVTLFENDSAQFAVMAMRMVQEHDFINLFKGQEEYLDKPHMHYWLAALSYLLFGIHDWAYRIPALLATALGAYSCYGLGALLYKKTEVGRLAALIFLTSQTIVLAAIDVRTDAVLTGFTIFAIWQLATYLQTSRLMPLLLGALGTGIAFSTKGQIALLVIGLPLLCHLFYTGRWKRLLNWRILVALLVFGLAILPMLYSYYHQFDLHPEKVIRGRTSRSGILFIFWEQSFERLSGEGVGKNSSDYFFFFHTFLWVFLPWTVAGIAAIRHRVLKILKSGWKSQPVTEVLTLGGILLIFIIISFAQFKLPHYLNITMPLFAIITAAYLHSLYTESGKRSAGFLLAVQYGIFSLVAVLALLLCFWVFPLKPWYLYILLLPAVFGIFIYALRNEGIYARIVFVSVTASLILNTVLNFHFYPSLLKYQAGSAMAGIVEENRIPVSDIYKISDMHTWALDFYDRHPVQKTTLNALHNKKEIWIYATEKDLQLLRQEKLSWDKEYRADQFRITRLQAKFLDPSRRRDILETMYLIHLP
jgi:4-amino-4-deoxy-L-arabinose transferase-like glycosyltransferase